MASGEAAGPAMVQAGSNPVIGIVGSPRRRRNTGILVERVLEGAASQGMTPSLFYLGDYQIGGCRACGACKRTQRCAQQDDMHTLYAALDRARGLVLGTPIYLDHVSAQTKAFLDRLYAYLGPKLEHFYPAGVKAVVVVTWGDSNPNAYDSVVTWLDGRLHGYFGIETVAVVIGHDTDSAPVVNRGDILRAGYAAGVRLANSLE